MLNETDREHLYLDLMSKLRNTETYRKMRMSDKLELLKSVSRIFQSIDEKDIGKLTGEFILENVSPRGKRRCVKLIRFAEDIEKKLAMSDPKFKENFKNKIRGINL